jgi:RNA polymerase sigma-70 factor (ECF subfamily)
MSAFYTNGTIGIEMNLGNANHQSGLRGLKEDELIAAAKDGNSDAFEALLAPYSKKIFRAVHRITRNREDAEDALQESFLKAFKYIKSFDGRSKFSTWLTRIAINSALMIVRKRTSSLASPTQSFEEGSGAVFEMLPDRAPNPEAAYVQRERGVLLHRAVGALAPKIRRALTLQRFHGLSLDETAEKMGITVGAVKSRLVRARWELRRALKESVL